jgi:hypothetical protein
MTEVVTIVAPRVTIATSVLAPVELNATLAPPAAPAQSVERPNLAIVVKRAIAMTVVNVASVVTVTAEQRKTASAMTASLVTIAGVTAPSAQPVAAMIARAPIVFATTVRARTAHAMTAVPRLEPIVTSVAVTSAAPRGLTATTAHEPIAPKAIALSVAPAMTARAPIVFVMTATRAPVAVTATIATSARAASRHPRMWCSIVSTRPLLPPKTWTAFRLATSA